MRSEATETPKKGKGDKGKGREGATPAPADPAAPSTPATPEAGATAITPSSETPGTQLPKKRKLKPKPNKQVLRILRRWNKAAGKVKHKVTKKKREKRGWMNPKYDQLRIDDAIKFICMEKGLYPNQLTCDYWMHNYTYKLRPKGIVYLWHLNQIPYGQPWYRLALASGCFKFLEKVREGKFDNVLNELLTLRPPSQRSDDDLKVPEPAAVAKPVRHREEEEQDEAEFSDDLPNSDEVLGGDDDEGFAEDDPITPLKSRRGRYQQDTHKGEPVPLPPIAVKKRVYTLRTPEVRKKIEEAKKEVRAEKIAKHIQRKKEAEEALLRSTTPAWLIKQREEKAAKAAAAQQKGGRRK